MQVVIIGNGITGVTAARRLRQLKPDWRIQMVSAESDLFFSRPALMYLYLGHMGIKETQPYTAQSFDDLRIDRINARVTGVDTAKAQVLCQDREVLSYDKLLFATGSKPNKFGWPGQDLEGVSGFYSLQDLENLESNSQGLRRAVIVGGGLIGLEMAEMFRSRGISVTMLVREPSYWANIMPNVESGMINEVIREDDIDLRLGAELSEIVDDGKGHACAVICKDGERIECQVVGLTAGVSPNLSALADSAVATGRGVLVDRSFRTESPEVYAAGDCAEIVNPGEERNTIEQLWYTGKMHGELVARVMAGETLSYDRGIWFNSAKFIDLEWHTYGQVTCGLEEGQAGLPACLVWKHADGRHSFRLTHQDGKLLGVNAMGIRYRHRICERWLAESRDLDYVLDHLAEANFDPEFFRRYEGEIKGSLKEQLK